MKTRFENTNMYVGPSNIFNDKYYWSVISDKGRLLDRGYSDTYEYAFNAARNYMKNHQNEVFDATEFHTEEAA